MSPLAGGTLSAANPASQRPAGEAIRSAEALLEQALACEIDGRAEERDALLAKAEALAPDHPAIKWQRGMVLVEGKWTPAEEVAVAATSDSLVAEYLARRNASEDTLQGNLALARWCQEKKLFEQERAHWNRVLTYEPDHARARARLGFVRVENEWISRAEIAHAIAEEAKAQAAIKKNGAGLQSVVQDLTSENSTVRERAAAKIRGVRDVEMIPLLERIVAGVSEEASFAVLEALAAMPEKEASLSIARFAVLSPSVKVSVEAEGLLKDRRFDQFVPPMIASMRAPVQSAGFSLERRMDARLVYREVFYREAMRGTEVVVNDVIYANSRPSLHITIYGRTNDPVVLGGRIDDLSVARAAKNDTSVRSAVAEAAIALDRANAQGFNTRLSDTLSAATGEQIGPDPQSWWNWWDQYNELAQSGPKQVSLQYSQSYQNVGAERYPDRPRIGSIWQRPIVHSCFAAGTPVLTNRGEVAIEQICIGDLVLAQDVETGEIAFKAVLETTVRPPAELLRVEHEKGSFRCTGGHPFWVAGEGWIHAKRLVSGMELHSLDGSVRVSDVVSDGEEETYNLIVADFANYFVTDARVLSHDNSSRQPTDAIVPGLQQR